MFTQQDSYLCCCEAITALFFTQQDSHRARKAKEGAMRRQQSKQVQIEQRAQSLMEISWSIHSCNGEKCAAAAEQAGTNTAVFMGSDENKLVYMLMF